MGASPAPESAPLPARRGWTAYLIAVVLCVAGLGAGLWGWLRLSASFQAMADVRVAAPTVTTVTLDRPGDWLAYHEFRSTLDGRRYDSPEGKADLQVHLVDPASGVTISLEPGNVTSTYNFLGRSGRSIGVLRVPHAGEWQLECGHVDGSEGPEFVLSLGDAFSLRAMVEFLVGLGATAVLNLAGLLVAILTWSRRWSNRRLEPTPFQ